MSSTSFVIAYHLSIPLILVPQIRIFNHKSNFEKYFIHQVLTTLTHNFSYTYASAVTAILNEFEGKNPKSKVIKLLNILKIKLEEQKQCFHYTNLQPLFKTTEIAEQYGYINEIGNRNKGNKSY